MKTFWSAQLQKYDGTQLRSRWIAETFGLSGDAMVAFCGPADVSVEHLVDLEDVARNAPIYSENMLHFILEHFDRDLEKMVWRQRLFIAQIEAALKQYPVCAGVCRKGNDLYDGIYKLSVSVATLSPISALIHTGINISSRNTPVPTLGLSDYGIPPEPLAKALLSRYGAELEEIQHACRKVRPVA